MSVVVLDTNCLIDLDEGLHPRTAALAQIRSAAHKGRLEIVVAGITASENPRRQCSNSFVELTRLIRRAGLAGARVLPPMAYWDVTFWDHCLWVNDEMRQLERRIHTILAPTFRMDDMRNRRKWINTKCDVQLVWTHLWHETDALVTSDNGIANRSKALGKLGARIYLPHSFVATL